MTDAAPGHGPVTRRDLLAPIGRAAGGAAMYQATTSLGFAADSTYAGPVRLEGGAKGASVLVLGAGLAGMTAAYELRGAGYAVRVLEYNDRPGGGTGRRAAATATRSSAAPGRTAASRPACTSTPAPGESPTTTGRCSNFAGASASRSNPSCS